MSFYRFPINKNANAGRQTFIENRYTSDTQGLPTLTLEDDGNEDGAFTFNAVNIGTFRDSSINFNTFLVFTTHTFVLDNEAAIAKVTELNAEFNLSMKNDLFRETYNELMQSINGLEVFYPMDLSGFNSSNLTIADITNTSSLALNNREWSPYPTFEQARHASFYEAFRDELASVLQATQEGQTQDSSNNVINGYDDINVNCGPLDFPIAYIPLSLKGTQTGVTS